MALERIEVAGVPIDILPPDGLESALVELLSKDGPKQIIFLSIWGLLKARKKSEYANCVKNADLIIPVSKSILKGASFLGYTKPYRYEPFDTVISILTILEKYGKSLYLLGGTKKTILRAERNVHITYPGLQIVGRYIGHYHKRMEQDIVSAIYKSSPALVLLSDGVIGRDCWFSVRREKFRSGLFLYYKDAVSIFAKKKKHISKVSFDRGGELYDELFHNPLKIFRFFSYLFYWCILLRERSEIRKQKSNE